MVFLAPWEPKTDLAKEYSMTALMNVKNWWEETAGFFGTRYMEGDDSYEGFLSTPMTLEQRSEIEVDGIIELLQLDGDARLLDCPCGYGRHSLRLAQRGFRVVGVDINGEELAVARRKGASLPNVEFVKNDMRHLPFENEFDVAINMFYSFGFFESDEENVQVLRRFYAALKSGGRFLMHTDVNISRIMSGKYKLQEERSLRSGKKLQIVESYDATQKRVIGSWKLLDSHGSEVELTPYSVRVYTFDEFADWCYSLGFRKVTGYGDWARSPLTDESEEMMVIAEK
jgi:SAM-dependent methyltransferase